ncbi:F5/8 type C domain-containing protein [Paenibacillus catalpae]|uniref:F5/8 type C domain-containing protein n=1 Tax=Paenibacillus catalpae TaxID=1045775 RepID=A0A1I1T0G4_9BACL|nr:discoidin domain-containing protein [Paenibacillus catalpae]SFD52179.1 F5/8 type C domain-containing protein [Paenibacillus catalpae]
MKKRMKAMLTAVVGVTTVLSSGLLDNPAPASAADPVLTSSTADNWTNLFNRAGYSNTWLNADGIYSTPLNEVDSIGSAGSSSKTFFIFSDTILGSANAAGTISNLAYQNHSSAVLTGNTPTVSNMSFKYGDKANLNTSQGNNLFGYTAWMQEAIALGGNVYVFGIPFDGDWKPKQVDLITIPVVNGEPNYAGFTKTSAVSKLYFKNTTYLYDYGVGIMNNSAQAGAPNPDGYIYLYGYRDALIGGQKDLIVSRVLRSEFPNFNNLKYWNGSSWSSTITDSAALLSNVSTELSVTPVTSGPYSGKYIAVYTNGVQSADMMYAIGDSLTGPFAQPVKFYTAPEFEGVGSGQRYTYNAKAHPHLSSPGQLLISYNVNRMGGANNTNDYRPRFVNLNLGSSNLALNKSATASSTDDASSRTAVKAFDGNSGTRWSSAYSDPQWIYVDLGSSQTISRVRLSWEAAYGKSYQIQVSNNASDWTTVYSTTTGDGAIDDITFNAVSGRYVRMYGTQRVNAGWGYSLWDFEVYNN